MGPDDADIGADLDVEQIMADVSSEVERKRKAGSYPREVVMDIESSAINQAHSAGSGLDGAIAELRLSAQFSSEVETASSKKFIAPAVERVKSLIQSTVKWYVGAVLDQIRLFSDNSVQAMTLMARRLEELEARLESVESKIGSLPRGDSTAYEAAPSGQSQMTDD